MENNIICCLHMCLYPKNKFSNNGQERIIQYRDCLLKFFEYKNIFEGNKVDIIICDNSINKNEELPFEIKNIIPSNVKVYYDLYNDYGAINKGCGLIDKWLKNISIIEKYKWLIHFEPRQMLINFDFFNNFLKEPRNLFKLLSSDNTNYYNHFHTGLFGIEISLLINYIKNVNLNYMCNNKISIEYDLFNYFKINKILFYKIDKLNLIQHDYMANCNLLV